MVYCKCDGSSEIYLYTCHIGYQFNIPSKGQNFCVETVKEALFRLRELKEQGLKIPDSAFERLEGEYLDFLQETQLEQRNEKR